MVFPAAAAVEPDDAGEDDVEEIAAGEIDVGPGGLVGTVLFGDEVEAVSIAEEGADAGAVFGADYIVAFALEEGAGGFGLVEEDEITVGEKGFHVGVGGEAGDEGLGGGFGEMEGDGVDFALGAFAGDGLVEAEEAAQDGDGVEAGLAVGVGAGEVFGEFVAGEEVEWGEAEVGEDEVGEFGGEGPNAFEDVVHVGLGDAGEAGEAALAAFAVGDPGAEQVEEPVLQALEGEWGDFHWK